MLSGMITGFAAACSRNSWAPASASSRRSALGELKTIQRKDAAGYDAIFEMDADFSHQPRFLPDLIATLEEADVAIGSRYVEGGGIENCKARRRIISRVSNTAAGTILGLPIRDATAGFVGWKRHVLSAIDFSSITGEGYAFQVELKYRAHRAGFNLVEVPILFWDRVAGRSKLEASAAMTMWRVLRMRG